MAEKKLSPRQRMINMMYLVLTALLALNVSKEVLNSFFEVNLGLVKTTETLEKKSNNTYRALSDFNNKDKSRPYIELTDQIRPKVKEIIDTIQGMKYDLVYASDKGEVYLGGYDHENENDEFLREDILYKNLSEEDKNKKIAWLATKDDRNSSGDLFKPKNKNGRASNLKNMINDYRLFLIDLLNKAENSSLIIKSSADQLIAEINNSLAIDTGRTYGTERSDSWEEYNFYDMPSVGALTLLSKWQADIKNMEGEVAEFLAANIDATDLKFSSAVATTIPSTNFVTTGDEFKSQIFLSAFDAKAQPEIYIGDYDSSMVDGEYVFRMKDQSISKLEVSNGKGDYVVKTRSIGPQSYKGIIKIVQDKGFKTYPFTGNYVVAAKGAVASPTNMNVLYRGIQNPISVSVAGYLPSQITVSCSNGKLTAINKKAGKYEINPVKLTNNDSPIVTLYVNRDGKRINMGTVDFKVKKVPDPVVMCGGKVGGSVTRGELIASQQIIAKMKDFPFDRDALSYGVISYDVIAFYKGVRRNIPTVKGQRFNDAVKKAIKQTASGEVVTFANIKVKMRNVKGADVRNKGSLTFTIK